MYHPVLATGTSPADVTPVVIAGQTIPDGNGEFYDFGGWTINDQDEVSFWSSIQNGGGPLLTTNGIFVGHKDGTISQLIRSKDPAPGEPNLIYSLNPPTPINPAGQFTFSAEISDSHFGTGNNYGLYLANSSGDIARLARSFYPAPGTGYLFGYFVIAKVNDDGVTTFSASLIDSFGGFHGYGIFTATETGLLKTIAYSGQTAPNDLGTYSAFDLSVARSNAGKEAFTGYYEGDNPGSGIFVGGGNRQSALVLSGKTAPGGSVFAGFGSAGINKSGMVGFAAQLDDSLGFNGIFIARGKRVFKVAQAGDFVAGVEIDQLSFDPSFFDDLGQVLYLAIDPSGQSRILLFTPLAGVLN